MKLFTELHETEPFLISSVAASNVLPYLLKTPFTKNWFQPEPPPPQFTPAYVWWDEIYFLPLCFHGNVDERRAGEEVGGGGLLQPPKSKPSVWTIHKTVEINPSWGRFNKSLPVSPSDEHRGEVHRKWEGGLRCGKIISVTLPLADTREK